MLRVRPWSRDAQHDRRAVRQGFESAALAEQHGFDLTRIHYHHHDDRRTTRTFAWARTGFSSRLYEGLDRRRAHVETGDAETRAHEAPGHSQSQCT